METSPLSLIGFSAHRYLECLGTRLEEVVVCPNTLGWFLEHRTHEAEQRLVRGHGCAIRWRIHKLWAVFSAAFGRERSHPLLVEASSSSSSSSESSSSSSYSSSRLARLNSDPEDRRQWWLQQALNKDPGKWPLLGGDPMLQILYLLLHFPSFFFYGHIMNAGDPAHGLESFRAAHCGDCGCWKAIGFGSAGLNP